MGTDKKLVDLARRDLLRMAAMTGTAGLLANLGGALSPTLAAVANLGQRKGGAPAPEGKGDPNTGDLAIVNIAIQLEQKAINTYLGMEKQKLITNKDLVDVARQFAADHTAHRDALIKAATEEFKGTPAPIKALGTFPIPPAALKKELDAVRYALALEVIASKIYFDAFKDKLKTKPGRDLVLTILPVETQHVGVFRSVLKLRLKDRDLPNNPRLVPYALLDKYPTPEIPQGTPLDFDATS
jgi:rubrerythrin